MGCFRCSTAGRRAGGIAASDGNAIHYHKNTGLVTEAIKAEDLMKLPGKFAIGHVRYSTTGENSALNTQPVIGYYLRGQLAVAHNGNLTNTGATAQAPDLERLCFSDDDRYRGYFEFIGALQSRRFVAGDHENDAGFKRLVFVSDYE